MKRAVIRKLFLLFLVGATVIGLLTFNIAWAVSKPAIPLSLQEAERLAITMSSDNATTVVTNNTAASNPELSLGIEDAPTAVSPLSKDDATLVKIGVKQSILMGQSPELAAQRWNATTDSELTADQDDTRLLLKKLRRTWLDVYVWQHSLNTIEALQSHLTSQTKNNHILDQLALQQRQTLKKLTSARAGLGVLIGTTQAMRPMPIPLPIWPTPPPLSIMQSQLAQHPKLQSNAARIKVGRADLQQGKQQNNTTMNLGVNYGIRREDTTGDTHPDMLGMELQLKLPGAEQSSSHQKSREQLTQAMVEQQLNYRELSRQLRKAYLAWQTLQAKTNSTVLFLANDRAGTMAELTARLAQLANQVALAKARVDLLYFEVG